MKRYKIKITPKLLIKFKKWWRVYNLIQDDYWEQIVETEKKMAKDTGIKDIEFFNSTGEMAIGIGNNTRTMPLIHGDKLEK